MWWIFMSHTDRMSWFLKRGEGRATVGLIQELGLNIIIRIINNLTDELKSLNGHMVALLLLLDLFPVPPSDQASLNLKKCSWVILQPNRKVNTEVKLNVVSMFVFCLWQLDRNRSDARHKEKMTSDPPSHRNKRYNTNLETTDVKIHFILFSCCSAAVILMLVTSAALSSGVSSQLSDGRSCWTSCTPQQSLLEVFTLHFKTSAEEDCAFSGHSFRFSLVE